jgi:short-subunit dehydrogenase
VRILLTGASSGIGAATARRLARRGDDLVLVARGREGLAKTARAVEELGGTAIVATADITDRDALEAAFAQGAGALGGLDAVIANAGAGSYGLFSEIPADDVDRTVAVTLLGAANTVRIALPHLERTSGRIVLTGSVAGIQPMPLAAAYSASKHGLRGLIESIRMVHPGPVDTPFWVNVTPGAGYMPPKMPPAIAQDPDTIAKALVGALDHPRPEQIVGWTMRAANLIPRPLRDLALTQIVRLAMRHAAHDEPGRALWEPAGTGDTKQLAKR